MLSTFISATVIALTAFLPPHPTPAMPTAAATCELVIRAENLLGNFEIQDLMITVEAQRIDGQDYPAATHRVAVKVAPKGQARAKVTVQSPCAVRRSMKIAARGMMVFTNDTIDKLGVWQGGWNPSLMVARFSE